MRLAVVGTGLIGGSFALAARRHGLFDEVIGIEPDPARAQRALERGLVDHIADAVPDDADGVLLAGPSRTIAPWVARLAGHTGILFDAGSVKGAVLNEIRAAGGSLPPRLVPCHPLAGSEKNGPDAADPDLFDGADILITPAPETDPHALARVEDWWRRVGGRIVTMDADHHDAVLAVTSHLPHVLAIAYLQQVSDEQLQHAATGFRDFTRIGAADGQVWSAIFRLNRHALLNALDEFESNLAQARALLEGSDDAELQAFIEAARQRRLKFGHGS